MDDLVERISSAVGPRWISLLLDLKLNPDVKSRIENLHSNERRPNMKDELCCREVLNLWLKQPFIKDLTEEQQMKELLSIIKGIGYLREVALELTFMYFVDNRIMSVTRTKPSMVESLPIQRMEHGVRYHSRTQPMMALAPPGYGEQPRTAQHGGQPRSLEFDRPLGAVDSNRYAAMSTYVEHRISSVPRSTEVLRGQELVSASGEVLHALPLTCQTNGFTVTTEAPTAIAPVIVRDPCDEIIYVRDRYHRYALMDSSQRLLRCTWDILPQKLKITKEAIERLEIEKNFQERYYKLFMEYVRQHGENATFAELRKVLLECNENLAVSIMEERLRTRKELVISAVEYDFLSNKDL